MTPEENRLPEAERVLHMWEPLPYSVEAGYDYLRPRWHQRLGTGIFRGVVTLILAAYLRLAFGFRVKGRENLRALGAGGAVAVCNHVHPMDCTMVDRALLGRRVYYLTLDSNFRIPVVRHIIRWLGAVPVSRSPEQIRAMFAAMESGLSGGAVVQVYPEGVLIPYHRELGSFRNGAFRMAVDSRVPVLPMVIRQQPPEGLYRLYKRKPCLHLEILPPVYPDLSLPRREAVATLNRTCRAQMEARLLSEKEE